MKFDSKAAMRSFQAQRVSNRDMLAGLAVIMFAVFLAAQYIQ
ncbi:MAG: hypothetical protein OQJ98_00545 [Candidatus Pacebacteria bacterium]|nr:hypothetical protein [Candidatus Paceibacterota bacterium]